MTEAVKLISIDQAFNLANQRDNGCLIQQIFRPNS